MTALAWFTVSLLPVAGIIQVIIRTAPVGATDVDGTARDGAWRVEVRLGYCRNLIGRDITTSSELSKSEASRVIDALKSDGAS